MNGIHLKKKNVMKFHHLKEEMRNLRHILIGSSNLPPSNIPNSQNELKSDNQISIRDCFCGKIKCFYLLDQELDGEEVKKIQEYYENSQTLSNLNYDNDYESKILLHINPLSLKNQLIIDNNWLNINKHDKNVDYFILFNEESENSSSNSKETFLNKIKLLGTKPKKRNPNYNAQQDKKDIKVGDIKYRGIASIATYNFSSVFLSVGNIDIFLYVIELLSDFRYLQEKKANLIVFEVINVISSFTKKEIRFSKGRSGEIVQFFNKNGFNYFSLLLSRVKFDNTLNLLFFCFF